MHDLQVVPSYVTLSGRDALQAKRKGDAVQALPMPYEVWLWLDGFVKTRATPAFDSLCARQRAPASTGLFS
jgi:hypothetical protein